MKVLFVCLGNICRSPMAEAILKKKIQEHPEKPEFQVESAGTGSWHIGEFPDPRTIEVGEKKGLIFDTTAKQVKESDFDAFDYIIAMDHKNYENLITLNPDAESKIIMMASFLKNNESEIADPYWGEIRDFQKLYEQLDIAIDGLLNYLIKTNQRNY